MMTNLRKTTLSLAALVLALATAGTASAQTTPQSAGSTQSTMGSMHGGMHMQDMQNMKCEQGINGMQCMHMGVHMQGMHTMQATVTSADAKTGIVEVNADGMALRLPFPGLSSDDLKSGDKITVMMAYSKP